jgi:hypothetical protein
MIYILDNRQPYSARAVYFIEDQGSDLLDHTALIEEVAAVLWEERYGKRPLVIGMADHIDWIERNTTTLADIVSQHWWKFDDEVVGRLSAGAKEVVLPALQPHEKELNDMKEYR